MYRVYNTSMCVSVPLLLYAIIVCALEKRLINLQKLSTFFLNAHESTNSMCMSSILYS